MSPWTRHAASRAAKQAVSWGAPDRDRTCSRGAGGTRQWRFFVTRSPFEGVPASARSVPRAEHSPDPPWTAAAAVKPARCLPASRAATLCSRA